MDSFKCSKCGNTDLEKVGFLNGQPYCRACLQFKENSKNIFDAKFSNTKPKCDYFLSYELSEKQKELSNTLILNYKNQINTFVNAVCGSGKTEIVLELIKYVINSGGSVGFAIPRRDVVIEIYNRLVQIFKGIKIVAVYGSHHEQIYGDIICLTTHQLYRYKNYFDLLIIDEVDAFPFKNNDVLYAHFKRSLRGFFVLLSATYFTHSNSYFQDKKFEIVSLNERFHKHLLPVPRVIIVKKCFQTLFLLFFLRRYVKSGKPCFIFCPTIEICEIVFKRLSIFLKGGEYVHSKRKTRNDIISGFKNKKYKYLVTTHVLERGVTVENLQVIVFLANHPLFDFSSLIQIAGRVGRKASAPEGEVLFITDEVNSEIKEAIRVINEKNTSV